MTFKHDGKELEMKYTFNSFRFMQDFDLQELEAINTKPFTIITVTRKLMLGALNWTPNKRYSITDIDAMLETYVETESIGDLVTELVEMLQTSDFFKSLQGSK